jgi:aconitate hydratase
MPSKDSFKSKSTLTAGGKTYTYYSLAAAAKAAGPGWRARALAVIRDARA